MSKKKASLLEVRIKNMETGETSYEVLKDDWYLIVSGKYFIKNIQSFPESGTYVITVSKKS